MDASPRFGVMKSDGIVSFCIGVPDANEVKLKLYAKDTKTLPKEFPMKRELWQGDIFTFRIAEKELTQYEGYRYEALGYEFIDPYAKKIVGRDSYGKPADRLLGGFCLNHQKAQKEQPLHYSYSDLILYELHVRGFTKSKDSSVEHKGTFLGVASKAPYLTELGVNAVVLQPCYEFNEVSNFKDVFSYQPKHTKEYVMQRIFPDMTSRPGEVRLNYWGYTRESYYYAPKASYASNPQDATGEFKKMVQLLHESKIEVWMQFYFPEDVLPAFVTRCLHYWVNNYHIDGFYVYASDEVNRALSEDVAMKQTKLMFDYQLTKRRSDCVPTFKNVGCYNREAQTTIRKFLRGEEGQTEKLAMVLKETNDSNGIVHGITSHDGFTLLDLFSYDLRHNEANGEDNRDGTEYNFSMNCGAEGVTKSRSVKELRKRMIKNALMLVFMAQATPLLIAGDEFGNSQNGNNNAYCQDNEIGWINWKQKRSYQWLYDFTRQLIAFRKSHPVLHNPNLISGKDYAFYGCPDLSFHGTNPWYPDYSLYSRNLCMLLNGAYAKLPDRSDDHSCLLLCNMHQQRLNFGLIRPTGLNVWKVLISTESSIKEGTVIEEEMLSIEGRSIVLLIDSVERKKN